MPETLAESSNNVLEVSSDLRVGAIGRTQTGKTFLMERLCKQQPRVIVVDTKQRVGWNGYHLTFTPEAALQPNIDKITLRIPEGVDIPNEWWTKAMRLLNRKGGGVIYIDEMPMITSPNFAPRGLKDVFRIGAELGVGVWWSAQEATGVSNTVIRQTDVLCLFNNHGASDRDKLINTVGDMGEVTARLNQYEFVVYKAAGVYDADAIDIFKAVP